MVLMAQKMGTIRGRLENIVENLVDKKMNIVIKFIRLNVDAIQ